VEVIVWGGKKRCRGESDSQVRGETKGGYDSPGQETHS